MGGTTISRSRCFADPDLIRTLYRRGDCHLLPSSVHVGSVREQKVRLRELEHTQTLCERQAVGWKGVRMRSV